MHRKQIIYIVLIAFFVGALGSILLGRFFLPWVANVTKWESLNRFVTTSPIVVNRTTEVQINEGVNLIELSKQLANVTVSIYNTDNSYMGLGTIMSSDGLIFTTKSSIKGSTILKVVLTDGRIFTGTVRASDPKSDLVVVTIEAQGLTTASFGSSLDLKTGQRIVTSGIANRNQEREFYTSLITSSVLNNKKAGISSERLSDAFANGLLQISGLNYGGAPIANLEGRLVGMVINDHNEIMITENIQTALGSYLESGKIIRPTFGVTYTQLSSLQAGISNKSKAGVVINSIGKTEAAGLSGILAGDYIVEMDGQSLENVSFEQILNQKEPNAQMKVRVIRGDKELDLTVNLKPTQ